MIKKSIIIFCSLFTLSCSDEVKQPIDESEDLGHDIWHKVSFSFIEGEVSSNGVFNGYKDDENLTFKTVQAYNFSLADDLTVKTNSKSVKLVLGNTYGLVINYYNKKNELMNYQFTTPEMAPIHQHFFVTSLTKSLIQRDKKVIDYVYRDTNITNKMLGESGTVLRDEKDPIGLKGYFKVFEKPKDKFDFRVVLVHILGEDKLDKNGNPYLFYQRTKLGNGVTDLDQRIPMKIIAEKGTSTYIEDIAKVFNTSKEKIKRDIEKRVIGTAVKL